MSRPQPAPPLRARRTVFVALTAAGIIGLTVGCASGGQGGPAGSPQPSASLSPSPETTTASASPTTSAAPASPTPSSRPTPPGFSLDDQRSAGWPRLGADAGLGREARVGAHEGYDRVVYEFTGTAAPDYQVRYVDEPIDDPSGNPSDVPGDVWLEVQVTSVGYPGESAPTPDEPLPSTLKGTGIVAAPALWGGFEGVGQQFIGLRGEQRPFRVSVLKNPGRLVVDVAR